ncbi:hypothetical protein ZEAMMB73_Zm00001d032727 [Zea mays]|uniref:Uncharacterized protein n=1 Tax=Zea mays TaxID=4577 RepID=A0A1D6KTM2_MAIZE|nr:hypothetical protein ZEAMMB73_Zm00001d032727 [Zea mays]
MVHHQAAGGWATTAEGQCVRIKRRVEENGERARIRSGSCCGSLLFLFTRVFLTSGETARSRSETTIVGKSQPSVTPLHVRDPQTSSSCFRIGKLSQATVLRYYAAVESSRKKEGLS